VLRERSRHTSTQHVTPLIGNVQNGRIQGQEVDLWGPGLGRGQGDCSWDGTTFEDNGMF
jgi:hypothetical protein